MRVRVMSLAEVGDVPFGGEASGAPAAAVIELDARRSEAVEGDPALKARLREALTTHGLSLGSVRAFKSGSVAKHPP